jgi:hypothetical protein
MSPSLSVVADNDLHTATAAAAASAAAPVAAPVTAPVAAKTETVAERVRKLQAEARQLAKDHIRALSEAMVGVEQIAAEIAEGGDAYPPGVRDLARRFVEDIEARVQTLEAITARTL